MAGVKGRSGGHNRKTVQAHELGGTFRKDRHANGLGPEVVKGDPVPPAPLRGLARKAWLAVVEQLRQANVLSKNDAMVIYQFAQLFRESQELVNSMARRHRVERKLLKRAESLEGSERDELLEAIAQFSKQTARMRIEIRSSRLAVRQYLVELGLTPVSRGRVHVDDRPPGLFDEFSEFDVH